MNEMIDADRVRLWSSGLGATNQRCCRNFSASIERMFLGDHLRHIDRHEILARRLALAVARWLRW